MNDELLEILVCPACLSKLDYDPEHQRLCCTECTRFFPIINGVPQMLMDLDPERESIAHGFGEQWKKYSHFKEEGEQQFLDWLRPVRPEFFQDKLVLDAGCGRGHHALNSASFGARMVVGVDLGRGSTEVAYASTEDIDNISIVRADLLALPFRPGTFDYAYSVGVLHHLPEPRAGFKSVLSRVRPGGHISAWVYGAENNEWIVRYVDPIRTNICSRLPDGVLSFISQLCTILIILVTRAVYRPLLALFPDLSLFYKDYLMYISGFTFRDIETIVFDHLQPSVAFYISKEEFSEWFEGLSEVIIGWHNSNSWRGFAAIPESTAD